MSLIPKAGEKYLLFNGNRFDVFVVSDRFAHGVTCGISASIPLDADGSFLNGMVMPFPSDEDLRKMIHSLFGMDVAVLPNGNIVKRSAS